MSIQEEFGDQDRLASLLTTDSQGQKWGLYQAAGETEFTCTFSTDVENCLIVKGIMVGKVYSQTMPFSLPKRRWELGQQVLGMFMVSMALWGLEASAWMGGIAKITNLALPELRSKCFRTLLADLQTGEDGTPRRTGNDSGSALYYDSIEWFFPVWTNRTDLLKSLVSWQRFEQGNRMKAVVQDLMHIMSNRRLGFILGERFGYFSQLPAATDIGDRVAILNGCPIPFVLRHDTTSSTFRLIGCAYVSGMMDGQAFKNEEEHRPEQEIKLS